MTSSKGNFEQKINKLKSKPNQKVLEDEYIKVTFIRNSGAARRNQILGILVKAVKRQINHGEGRCKRVG